MRHATLKRTAGASSSLCTWGHWTERGAVLQVKSMNLIPPACVGLCGGWTTRSCDHGGCTLLHATDVDRLDGFERRTTTRSGSRAEPPACPSLPLRLPSSRRADGTSEGSGGQLRRACPGGEGTGPKRAATLCSPYRTRRGEWDQRQGTGDWKACTELTFQAEEQNSRTNKVIFRSTKGRR